MAPHRRQMQRVYSYKDRARLKLVVQGRSVGLSLAEIRHLLETYDDRGEVAQNALALRLFQQRLEALRTERSQVDTAIATLSQAVVQLSSAPAIEAAEAIDQRAGSNTAAASKRAWASCQKSSAAGGARQAFAPARARSPG